MSEGTGKKRANLWVLPETDHLLADYAAQWEVSRGDALDRLVRQAVGQESAARQAAQGLDVLEEMVRRALGDYTTQSVNILRQLLDERFEAPHLEASTARLLLFALLAHLTSAEAAIANEDEALRVARLGRERGTIPLLMRRHGTEQAG